MARTLALSACVWASKSTIWLWDYLRYARFNSIIFFFSFWNLQDQKVHRHFGSSQLGTSWNQPLCLLNTRDEQHTLSQPTRRSLVNSQKNKKITAYQKQGKHGTWQEVLKHASTLKQKRIQDRGSVAKTC